MGWHIGEISRMQQGRLISPSVTALNPILNASTATQQLVPEANRSGLPVQVNTTLHLNYFHTWFFGFTVPLSCTVFVTCRCIRLMSQGTFWLLQFVLSTTTHKSLSIGMNVYFFGSPQSHIFSTEGVIIFQLEVTSTSNTHFDNCYSNQNAHVKFFVKCNCKLSLQYQIGN